jgi:hypothetical protein
MRSLLGKGPYFFDPKLASQPASRKLIPEWHLYVPEHLDPAEELRS